MPSQILPEHIEAICRSLPAEQLADISLTSRSFRREAERIIFGERLGFTVGDTSSGGPDLRFTDFVAPIQQNFDRFFALANDTAYAQSIRRFRARGSYQLTDTTESASHRRVQSTFYGALNVCFSVLPRFINLHHLELYEIDLNSFTSDMLSQLHNLRYLETDNCRVYDTVGPNLPLHVCRVFTGPLPGIFFDDDCETFQLFQPSAIRNLEIRDWQFTANTLWSQLHELGISSYPALETVTLIFERHTSKDIVRFLQRAPNVTSLQLLSERTRAYLTQSIPIGCVPHLTHIAGHPVTIQRFVVSTPGFDQHPRPIQSIKVFDNSEPISSPELTHFVHSLKEVHTLTSLEIPLQAWQVKEGFEAVAVACPSLQKLRIYLCSAWIPEGPFGPELLDGSSAAMLASELLASFSGAPGVEQDWPTFIAHMVYMIKTLSQERACAAWSVVVLMYKLWGATIAEIPGVPFDMLSLPPSFQKPKSYIVDTPNSVFATWVMILAAICMPTVDVTCIGDEYME